jgi:hypothetical protein
VTQDAFGIPVPDLQGLLGMGNHRLCDAQPHDPREGRVESIPKRSAVAFSVAGGPSDAFDRHQPRARFHYQDSGKRYAFRIDDECVVVATHPDGRTTVLDRAVSFTSKRAGEEGPAPPFDLIAASGGRVFAKAKGLDQFYFTTMDEMFIHASDDSAEFSVPSTYFKLDPEFNQSNAKVSALTAHLRGCFGDHPAVERFPQLFWPILEQNVMDMMIVKLDRGKWHLIDARPPLSRLNQSLLFVEIAHRMLSTNPVLAVNPFLQVTAVLAKSLLSQLGEQDDAKAPPDFVPTYDHVNHCRPDPLGPRTITLRSIAYQRVLDIGVGHVHWHEQYQGVTGGELQPMRTGRLLNHTFPHVTWMDLYRFANGPVRDGDGYIDGTCNYYALVQLKPDSVIDRNQDGIIDTAASVESVDGTLRDAFALLYADEQFYFTQRWRVAHPDDHQGLMTALVKGLDDDLKWDPVFQRPLYEWNPRKYWCPFRAGHIGLKSRMAVAAQVVLVTGGHPPDARAGEIYSINFSYATMDRTWRWRPLPAPARYFNSESERWDETMTSAEATSVYPETIRLREDMTIHLKGTRDGIAGRWYQRYLPAGNLLVSAATESDPVRRPPSGFAHPWKFLPESVFAQADRFSHLGVFDTVDSRSQYYPVAPASAADVQKLAAGQNGAWVDAGGQFAVDAWRFPWHGGALSWEEKRPPSLFEPVTRLRIVQRGGRWIAMHWDKRDDDLVPFAGLPQTVMLTNDTTSVKVTLGPNIWLEAAPGVRRTHFWWEGSGPTLRAAIGFTAPFALYGHEIDNLWRIRMAAFDQENQPGHVASLLTVETAGNFTRTPTGYYEYRWTPTTAELPLLQRACSPAGEATTGCSIWFEDLVGHVTVPDEIRWLPPPIMSVTLTPTAIPLQVPTRVTVTAVDSHTAHPVQGTVAVDDQVVGSIGIPFTYTFATRVEEEFDPEIRVRRRIVIKPVLTVSAADYPDVTLTPRYYTPALRTRVEPTAIPIGRPVQVIVRAEDADTGAPVTGRVAIAGQDVGATNTLFSYTFTAPPATGVVTAPGFPNRTVNFPVYAPQQNVWVEAPYLFIGRPSQLTIRDHDATTGAPVAGRVLLNGQDVAATNTPFTYTFASSPPSGVVRAPAYPERAITWPPLRTPSLAVSIQPYPVRTGAVATYTVRAVDADTGAPIDGAVMVGSASTPIARTNVPFPYTFRMTRRREFDPEIGVALWTPVPPVAFVTAAGYATAALDLGL